MWWEKTKNFIYFFLNLLSPLVGLFRRLPRVSILVYHSIGAGQVLFTVSAKDFARQLEFLKRKKYRVISLKQLFEKLKNQEDFDDQTVVLTFDDGYQDNYINAWPLLKKYNFPATIFLATAFIGQAMNNSQNMPIAVLTEAQIKEMSDSGLIKFGSHTHSHPRLENISDEEFVQELSLSRSVIEKITGKKCDFLAYPKGYFRESFGEILEKKGWSVALTVREGLVTGGDDVFNLPRNFVYSVGGFEQFKGKLSYGVLIYNKLKKIIKNKK